MSAQAHFNQQVQALDHYLYKLQGVYRDPTKTRNDLIECLRANPALQPRMAPLGIGIVLVLVLLKNDLQKKSLCSLLFNPNNFYI
jgi:hypothetical protein